MKIFITIFLFIVYIDCQSQTADANMFVFSGKLVDADTGFVCLSYTDAEKKVDAGYGKTE